MVHKRIELPAREIAGGKEKRFIPSLTTYIIENNDEIDRNRRRPIVIICPGGAYGFKSFREAEPVALRMMALGFNACVLDYSVTPMDFPAAFIDLCEGVFYVRKHAAELNSSPDNIVVCGFSAGGHLAASLSVWWDSGMVEQYLPYKRDEVKPNALLLGYPVICSGTFAHQGSIANLLGAKFGISELMDKVSLEKNVSASTPPTFIWHTADDDCVPVQNTLLFTAALAQHGVPFECHVFRSGCHGLSLANRESAGTQVQIENDVSIWPELFQKFIHGLFYAGKETA